ncbi:Acetyl-coenzyme A transporter 1 [Schistosoma japonicum]|uniref:Acetyl-coenzyme A transporter 1 n=1 Tax=Schistosoma japonicum TaxID=6182 RepID=A0A4Z2CL17_SCHJA|nr:Acetyl-coenzyme A transporter 1 [Schistosoma japonicum]
MKLLWAPIVDSVYIKFVGRRKTWLTIAQYSVAIVLLVLASRINDWFGRDPDKLWSPIGSHHPVNIIQLTIMFFVLTFAIATQDIAVDGWALTMLTKKNIGWVSTCNKVGQGLGFALAFVPLVCLESPDIPNKYFRRTPIEDQGLITFSGFLYATGFSFMMVNTIVMIFRHEKGSKLDRSIRHFVSSCSFNKMKRILCRSYSSNIENIANVNYQSGVETDNKVKNSKLSILDFSVDTASYTEDGTKSQPKEGEMNERGKVSMLNTYRALISIVQMKPVAIYIIMTFILMMCAFSTYSATNLKLIEYGFPKEKLGLFGLLFLPLDFILPFMFVKCTIGPRPLTILVITLIPKLLVNCLFIPITHFTPYFRISTNDTLMMSSSSHNSFSWAFYAILTTAFTLDKIASNLIFVLHLAFGAKISDPVIGGTYLTLLTTITNFANGLGSSMCLTLIEPLTFRSCNRTEIFPGLYSNSSVALVNITPNVTCSGNKDCTGATESCVKLFDGYYVQVIAFLFIGIIFFICFLYPKAKYLESLPLSKFLYDPTVRQCCFRHGSSSQPKIDASDSAIISDNNTNQEGYTNIFMRSNLS